MLRFAQNPMIDMDINSLRIAILNHIISKQTNQNLIIRLEDLNNQENNKNKDKNILNILSLFSIDYSQVLIQSDNIKYHRQISMQLLMQKKAFNCFCSDEALQKDKDEAKAQNKPYSYGGFCENLSDEITLDLQAPFTVRIKKPTSDITFTDTIQGDCRYKPFEVDSFVILNHQKTPTSDFASAVDDMLNDIDTIIEDKKYLDNIAKQIHIRNSLEYTKKIQYVHIPSIINGDQYPIQTLLDDGYLPIAIANYIVLLGYDTPSEIFTIEDAIKWFDITKISQHNVKFDIEKLKTINTKYLESMDNLRLSKILGYADEDIGKLAKLYLEQYATIKDIKTHIDLIFTSKSICKNFPKEFTQIQQCLKEAPFIDDFDQLLVYITDKTKLINNNLLVPLQYLLTGTTKGPKLNQIYPFIKNYLKEIIK